jgi:uncharacterized protein YpuA (DUF1002 family)
MRKKIKKTAARLLSLLLTSCLLAVPALAAEEAPALICTVIGEDLTNAQTREAYSVFGLTRGDVPELSMSNAEERQLLSGIVPDELIGSKACTCVSLRLLPEGSGVRVSAAGLSWCSAEACRAALETAGITDAEFIAAAPEPASGAGFLPAAYKAWEYLTGRTLDEDARQAGLQELAAAEELAGEMGAADAVSLTEKIRSALSATAEMSDEELSAGIRELAAERGVKLNDTQVQMLMDLCRRVEKLSDNSLTEKIDDLKDAAEKIEEFNQKKEELKETASTFGEKVKRFFSSAADFFSSLFGKK